MADELTEFAMTGDHTAWWVAGDYDTQEFEYQQTKLSGIRGQMKKAIQATSSSTPAGPTTVQTALQMRTDDGLYVNLHEAACVDYPTMHLTYNEQNNTFVSTSPPDARGDKGLSTNAHQLAVAHRHRGAQSHRHPGQPHHAQPQRTLQNRRHLVDSPREIRWRVVGHDHRTRTMGLHRRREQRETRRNRLFQAPRLAQTLGQHGQCEAIHRLCRQKRTRCRARRGLEPGWEDWFGHQKDYVFDFVTPYPDFNVKELHEYAKRAA